MSTDPRVLHARTLICRRTDLYTLNNLIALYSKTNNASCLSHIRSIFSLIPSPDIFSWTSLISAHANSFLSLSFFVSMLRHPIFPNQRTLASLLKTCTTLSCLSFGLALHALSIKLSINTQPFAASAMITFYSKYWLPDNARKVLDGITETERDEVCYSAMIVGLAQNSKAINALSVFAEMKERNVGSTLYSISGALRATAEMAALEQCRAIHGHAVVTGFDGNVVVGSALIDAYGKAGIITDARRVFDELMPYLNLVGWNAMMAGYAQQGDKTSVLELCDAMETKGLVPDEYSFLAILTAFANAGLFAEIERWIEKMRMEHGVEPRLEHYTCLVHAMARMGRLEDAERIATTMPTKPDAAVWRALLSACANVGAADKALVMVNRLLELNQHDHSAYVIAANVLSSKGRWNQVSELRKLMKNRSVKKEEGMSWMEVKGKIHVFFPGDRRHERTEEIYAKLEELMDEIETLGYEPVLDEKLLEGGEKQRKIGT